MELGTISQGIDYPILKKDNMNRAAFLSVRTPIFAWGGIPMREIAA